MNPGAVLHELTHAVVRHYADDVKPHGRTFVCTQAELWRAAGLDDESE